MPHSKRRAVKQPPSAKMLAVEEQMFNEAILKNTEKGQSQAKIAIRAVHKNGLTMTGTFEGSYNKTTSAFTSMSMGSVQINLNSKITWSKPEQGPNDMVSPSAPPPSPTKQFMRAATAAAAAAIEEELNNNLANVSKYPQRRSRCCKSDPDECPCCGENYSDNVDSSDEELSSDESEPDEETIKARSRMNMLLIQNAKAKIILQQNKYYNQMLCLQKTIQEQQLSLLQRTNRLNSSFIRNMEAVIRLGFCPMMLQEKTDFISEGLLDVHKCVVDWDDSLDALIPRIKSNKDKTAVLPSLLQVFRENYGTHIELMTDSEFENALEKSMEQIPTLIPDEKTLKRAIEDLDMAQFESDWEFFEQEMSNRLLALEIEFIELCLVFGVRVRLPDIADYEWAHAVGSSSRKIKSYTHDEPQRKTFVIDKENGDISTM